jgi:hypothetical protein
VLKWRVRNGGKEERNGPLPCSFSNNTRRSYLCCVHCCFAHCKGFEPKCHLTCSFAQEKLAGGGGERAREKGLCRVSVRGTRQSHAVMTAPS